MKKILIIEDEVIVRSIYRRKFEISGYKVEVAEEGAAALNLLPTFRPDIIQVDIMMPGMDGVEVIRQIRSWPDFKLIPIIVLSSFYRPDLAAEAWKAGATKCISKMDCTPNLALELAEQILNGEDRGFGPGGKLGTIPLPKGALEFSEPAPQPVAEPVPKPPPSPSKPLTLPTFAREASSEPPLERAEPSIPRTPTRPSFSTPPPAPKLPPAPTPTPAVAETVSTPPLEPPSADSGFRMEIRQEFLKRAPQIQTELRERVGALIKSKSTGDQLGLLRDLGTSVASLCSLSGITGFSRISHLSGALDALIKDVHKKPAQMTSSVLRTITHASDCLNMLFRELERVPREFPQSMLILVVDDEPIARRTISVALGKASLRCVSLEDSRVALNILRENPFDLIFLDAEMPGLNGFELCAELRKLPTNKATPVIFVTSLTKFEIRAQSSLSGGSDLIAKPFLMMELAVKALTYLLKPAASSETPARPQ